MAFFGIKAKTHGMRFCWNNREDYAEDEYARPDFKLTVINREQALRLYDEGEADLSCSHQSVGQ